MFFIINKTKGIISYPLTEGFLQVKPGANAISDLHWDYVKKNFHMVKVQLEAEMIEENHAPDAKPDAEFKKNLLEGLTKAQVRKVIKNTFVNAELEPLLEDADADTVKLIQAQIKSNNAKHQQ